MDFDLNESQLLFRSRVKAFVDKKVIPNARKLEQSRTYPEDLVLEMAEIGLFGMTIPQSYGGLGLDCVSMAIVFEELSRGWMGLAGVLGTHSLSSAMISKFGTPKQKERYLPKLASGEKRTGIGLSEANAGSDLQAINTTAVKVDGGYIINGSKMWITNARHANPLPILVKTDPKATPRHLGMSIFLIETPAKGFSIVRDIDKLGYIGPETCEIAIEDLFVSDSQLLGENTGHGLSQALWALQLGRINVAARGIGLSQRAYDEALKYSNDRSAFGSPISDFQLIGAKLAEMAMNIQAGRLLTYWASEAVDRDLRLDQPPAMAKLFASELALSTSLESMRIHGGYGYSTDFEVERLYRDAPLLAIGEGTNEILKTVIAKSINRDYRNKNRR
ncbi:acyl-CoA dehydrogenase family protein [Acidithrix ferrooxidans]|uniref:Acyl-CoA dehydrogenase n=1 Tax=Acidithrix ferrooxidans TaxID=1280514 RepID=A0A0D8HEU6_9ACTN|nr:acyl-CoA dehydrogenase family protein [Acidithrix ferrooxidans]KJF16443.1 acyl-CoA dehydrogenase [Acidithrix ferrooxidans]